MIMHYNCRSSCTFASWFHTPLGTKMKEIKSKPAEANKSPGRNQSFPHHSLCHLACAWMEMEIEFYYVYKSKLWTFLCSSLSFGGCSRKKIFFFFPSSRSSSSSNRGDKIKLQCHHLLGWNQYGFPSPSSNILPERKADIIIAFFLTFSYRQSDCCSPQSQVINVDDDVRRESVGGKSGNKCELLNQKMKKRVYQESYHRKLCRLWGETWWLVCSEHGCLSVCLGLYQFRYRILFGSWGRISFEIGPVGM